MSHQSGRRAFPRPPSQGPNLKESESKLCLRLKPGPVLIPAVLAESLSQGLAMEDLGCAARGTATGLARQRRYVRFGISKRRPGSMNPSSILQYALEKESIRIHMYC